MIGDLTAAVDGRLDRFAELSDRIWSNPELRWAEHAAAAEQADLAEAEGFRVTRAAAGIPTAFVAEAGAGGPVIALLGEYDALEGMSQEAGVPEPRARAGAGGPAGHGCGHHLLGSGSLMAALAVKDHLAARGLPGRVRYVGCPAEEASAGKAFLVRDGVFDDVDAAFAWHPSDVTWVLRVDTLAYHQLVVRFRGRAAHASSSPHLGRSALDAAELMNVGVNFLREHMPPDARVHYAFLDAGGGAANVVPAGAALFYVVRDRTVARSRELLARVERIARGAAQMTDTEVAIELDGGASELFRNETLEQLLQERLEALGPVPFDGADQAEAERFAATLPDGPRDGPALESDVLPLQGRRLDPSSTDVGDVSWVVPTAQIEVACFARGCPAHSWQWVAQGTLPAAHKGMSHAAKALASAAVAVIGDPALLSRATREHERRLAVRPYDSPLPPDLAPPPLRLAQPSWWRAPD